MPPSLTLLLLVLTSSSLPNACVACVAASGETGGRGRAQSAERGRSVSRSSRYDRPTRASLARLSVTRDDDGTAAAGHTLARRYVRALFTSILPTIQ